MKRIALDPKFCLTSDASINHRSGFPSILSKVLEVVGNLERLGPTADVDVNNITMRFAMDITGMQSILPSCISTKG